MTPELSHDSSWLCFEKNDVKVGGGGSDVAHLAVSSIRNKCKPLDHIDDDDDDVKHTYYVGRNRDGIGD